MKEKKKRKEKKKSTFVIKKKTRANEISENYVQVPLAIPRRFRHVTMKPESGGEEGTEKDEGILVT
jgi:hypothetical protein